jgi:hypothetical protein
MYRRIKNLWRWLACWLLVGCSVQTEATGSNASADAASAVAACQATEKNCAIVPNCGADSVVATFGGDSSAGIPIHPDQVDGWVYAGPDTGKVVKWVTTTVNGVIEPAAYGCSQNVGYPSPPMQIVGTW